MSDRLVREGMCHTRGIHTFTCVMCVRDMDGPRHMERLKVCVFVPATTSSGLGGIEEKECVCMCVFV